MQLSGMMVLVALVASSVARSRGALPQAARSDDIWKLLADRIATQAEVQAFDRAYRVWHAQHLRHAVLSLQLWRFSSSGRAPPDVPYHVRFLEWVMPIIDYYPVLRALIIRATIRYWRIEI